MTRVHGEDVQAVSDFLIGEGDEATAGKAWSRLLPALDPVPTIRTHGDGWAVFAEWHGAERAVFRGSLFDCIAWRSEQ